MNRNLRKLMMVAFALLMLTSSCGKDEPNVNPNLTHTPDDPGKDDPGKDDPGKDDSGKDDPNTPETPKSKVMVKDSVEVLFINMTKKVQIKNASELQGVTYVSNHPDIVSVDEQGVLTSLKKGEAKITVSATKADPAEIMVQSVSNELPLFLFPKDNNYQQQIDEYEKSLERVFTPGAHLMGDLTFDSYINKSLPVIPLVAYNVVEKNSVDVIWALGKEKVNNCPVLRAMLKDRGFDTPVYEDSTKFAYQNAESGVSVFVMGGPTIVPYKANNLIKVIRKREYVDRVDHDVISTVNDFPGIEQFFSTEHPTHDMMLQYENKIGFRFWKEGSSTATSDLFKVQPNKVQESNINFVRYSYDPPRGHIPFIYGVLNCIHSVSDALSQPFRDWVAANGITGKWNIESRDTYTTAYVSNGNMEFSVYIESGVAWFYIYKVEDNASSTQKVSPMSVIAAEMRSKYSTLMK